MYVRIRSPRMISKRAMEKIKKQQRNRYEEGSLWWWFDLMIWKGAYLHAQSKQQQKKANNSLRLFKGKN